MITGKTLLTSILILAATASDCHGGENELFFHYERKYNLPPYSLVTLAQVESGLNPWALNINGIPVEAKSKDEAVKIIQKVASGYNYGIYFKKGSERTPAFFSSRDRAKAVMTSMIADGWKPVKIGKKVLQSIDVQSTDVCFLQLNYKHHVSSNFRSLNQMLDIDKCLDYGASFLAKNIERHGFKKGVGCYHNCGSKPEQTKFRKRYIARYMKVYDKYTKS